MLSRGGLRLLLLQHLCLPVFIRILLDVRHIGKSSLLVTDKTVEKLVKILRLELLFRILHAFGKLAKAFHSCISRVFVKRNDIGPIALPSHFGATGAEHKPGDRILHAEQFGVIGAAVERAREERHLHIH